MPLCLFASAPLCLLHLRLCSSCLFASLHRCFFPLLPPCLSASQVSSRRSQVWPRRVSRNVNNFPSHFAFRTFAGARQSTKMRAECLRWLRQKVRITLGKLHISQDCSATRAPNRPGDIGHTFRRFPYNPPRLLVFLVCCIVDITSLQRWNSTCGEVPKTKNRGEL